MKKIRCAIYTRKSAEEGLEQDFNFLDAQREACAAYVASHKAEGWVLLPTVYEDAGISGGTLERPGLQRSLADIDAGLVEQIVVYKVDRLTRSLSDFAKLVERLEAAGAVFVSTDEPRPDPAGTAGFAAQARREQVAQRGRRAGAGGALADHRGVKRTLRSEPWPRAPRYTRAHPLGPRCFRHQVMEWTPPLT